ncbi:MAG: hypothetical protein J6T25_02695 [Bacilli bacterium]|nr:hypothetical protein [Bacilli bacterium]
MKRSERIRIIVGAMINIIVFCLSVYCLSTFIRYAIHGNPDNRFRYFTNISTLTVGFIALPNAVLLVVSAIKGRMIYPTFLSIVKFIGLSMISLTFFTVLCFIAPLSSFKSMYQNMRFITHLVIPILVMASYFFLEEKTMFEWKLSMIGVVPSIIYTAIYGINVVLLKTWDDIYKVNNDGLWFLFASLVVLFNFAICLGLYFAKRALIKKLSK